MDNAWLPWIGTCVGILVGGGLVLIGYRWQNR